MATETFTIGSGVREAMKAAGDEPRGNEIYTHDPKTGAMLYSETWGRDALYRYTEQDGVKRLSFDGG